MRHIRWQWWLAAALLPALALLGRTVFAEPLPAPPFQTAGAVCPLSEDQTQRAIDAMKQMAVTFTTEPRCVNCHGAVNPFAAGDNGHTGGVFNKSFKSVPVSDPGLIGVTFTSDTLDEDATFGQCQDCHSGLPGWKLAPEQDQFKDKSPVEICQNQRLVFGKQLANSPTAFANHIKRDVKNVPFIEDAFRGDRGLNPKGKELSEASTGHPFRLEKPTSRSHEELNSLARKWADAMGSTFKGGDDCGCVPHHYALIFDLSGTIDTVRAGMTGHYANSGNGEIPLDFKDDASFEANADVLTVWDTLVTGNGIRCSATTPQTMKVTVRGNVTGNADDQKMHLTFDWTTDEGRYSGGCTSPSGPLPFNGNLQNIDSPNGTSELADGFDMPAMVGESKRFTVPIANGRFTYTVSIKQID